MGKGKLAKMVIVAYKTDDFKSKVGTFKLQLNPENYSMNYESAKEIEGDKLANGEKVGQMVPPKDPDLDITFFLDSTGVVPGCDDVGSTVSTLKSLCLDINGEIHQPNYLKVIWGSKFTYPCKLKSLNVDYLLFKSDGSPLRAKVDAKFKFFENPATKAKKTKKRSPDLTHLREVKAGDSLPAMCKEIYGDTKYYIQVAQVNKLVNFRRLIPGQKLVFPKLER